VVTVAPRYQFLQLLHETLQPRGYVEIGVQHGGSLALAKCSAVGIDPTPMVITPLGSNHQVIVATSDHFFEQPYQFDVLPQRIDLAFIDGMHLVEYALRDFINIEKKSHSATVIVFDDVLPYNAMIATRHQPPGDWTGDVWKLVEIMKTYRDDLRVVLVDTPPTGSLVVLGPDPTSTVFRDRYPDILRSYAHEMPVPVSIIERHDAVSQATALEIIKEYI